MTRVNYSASDYRAAPSRRCRQFVNRTWLLTSERQPCVRQGTLGSGPVYWICVVFILELLWCLFRIQQIFCSGKHIKSSQRLFLTFLIAETLPEHIRAQSVQIIFSTFKAAGVDISLQVVLISQNDSSGAAVQQRSCVQSPKLHSSVSGGCNLLHPQEVINL